MAWVASQFPQSSKCPFFCTTDHYSVQNSKFSVRDSKCSVHWTEHFSVQVILWEMVWIQMQWADFIVCTAYKKEPVLCVIWGKIYVFIIKQDILALIAKGEEYVFTIKLNIIALTVKVEEYVFTINLNLHALIAKVKEYVFTGNKKVNANNATRQCVIFVSKYLQENNL